VQGLLRGSEFVVWTGAPDGVSRGVRRGWIAFLLFGATIVLAVTIGSLFSSRSLLLVSLPLLISIFFSGIWYSRIRTKTRELLYFITSERALVICASSITIYVKFEADLKNINLDDIERFSDGTGDLIFYRRKIGRRVERCGFSALRDLEIVQKTIDQVRSAKPSLVDAPNSAS